MPDVRCELQPLPDRSFIGAWKWDPGRQLFHTDERLSRFFGLPPEAAWTGVPTEEVLRRLHPEDRAIVSPKFRFAAQKGLPFAESYRVMTKHDGLRQVRSYGRPFDKSDGSWQYAGAIIDMGGRPNDESALSMAIDHLMMAHELLKTHPPSMLPRLIEAVLLEAGYETQRAASRELDRH